MAIMDAFIKISFQFYKLEKKANFSLSSKALNFILYGVVWL